MASGEIMYNEMSYYNVQWNELLGKSIGHAFVSV